MKQPIQVKGVLKIFKLIFYLFLYLHWLACFWNIVVLYEGPIMYIVQYNGTYKNVFGDLLLNANDVTTQYFGVDFIYLHSKHFE
jgi:hypothetical protein